MDAQTDSNLGAVNLNSKDDSGSKRKADMDEETEVMEIDLSQGKRSGNEKDSLMGANKNEDEEGGDEPDAMNTSQQDLNQVRDGASDKKKLYNGFVESGGSEEDMEEGNRLVIDDVDEGALSKVPLSKGMYKPGPPKTQLYSCPKCEMVTLSAKAYLHHLDTVHPNRDGNKNKRDFHLLGNRSNANSPSLSSKTNDTSDYVNLSLPLTNPSPSVVADDEDEDGEDNRRDSSQMSLNLNSHSTPTMPMTISAESIDIDKMFEDDKKKKKKTRQEVDPGKYFEAVDSSGTKYACSQCGNIYKWRKSLNKHWKEKHLHDPLVEVASPPGMLELLKSGKYTQLGSRRIYDNNFLATIKTQKDDNTSHRSTPSSLRNTPSPPSFLNSSQILNSSAAAARLVASMATTLPSKMIGPFVANGTCTQPVFPGMGIAVPHLPLQNGFESASEESALDLTRDSKPDSCFSPFNTSVGHPDISASFDQDQPLDFSKKKDDAMPVKHEKMWEEMNAGGKYPQGISQYMGKVHRCSKCDHTSTSESDFAAHTASHYNKRVVKCFECKIQLNSMEELNIHFAKDHNKKLTEYKEAIKKIPHGLQQTYHLLNMDLQSIGELNNQDLGSSDSKSLKCKKCNFEAKWPAELQKHAVSHSEERPYICMVCGSTYKWKWDLVKHFQKSHPTLPNPYRRNDKRDTPDGSSEEDLEDEPESKKAKMSGGESSSMGNLYGTDDGISVEGIIAATQAGQRFVSSQPNLLDNEPTMEQLAFMRSFPIINASLSPELAARQSKAPKAFQDVPKNHPNGNMKKSVIPEPSTSPGPSTSKGEQLPYKCTMCNYHARWPSEVTQHMKNHSDSKPYLCPRCDYRSKWKWDVVKHLKRCGGGTINDVIDTTKLKRRDNSNFGPPNAIVSQQGKVRKMTPQPLSFLSSMEVNGQQNIIVYPRSSDDSGSATSLSLAGDMDQSQNDDMVSEPNPSDNLSSDSDLIDLTMSNNSTTTTNNNDNNNDDNRADNNVNNNYAAYTSGQPVATSSSSSSASTSSLTPTATDTISNTSRNPSPVPVSVTPSTSSSRQNCSAEIWDCPHCSFSTQSQAELKRHSCLHKDDKPFKCDECHYSTRWACDLKKHRKSYDHYPKRNNPYLNSNNKDLARNSQQQKCEEKAKPMESKARFKCFQCSMYYMSLQDLMDHRKTSHTKKDNSPQPETPKSEEIDAARIKHPRKQIRQFSCPKCPFLSKSRQTMEEHMEEHEQMEKNGLHCFYCSSQFKDKESLLDHIISHPAFNPKEWETFFMISEEEEQQQQKEESFEEAPEEAREKPSPSHTSINSDKRDSGAKSADDAATQARIQQILSEIPKQKPAATFGQFSPGTCTKYQCEWCPAEFINVTSIYKHAGQAHPIQLREQDNNMALALANLHSRTQETQQKASSRTEPAEALLLLKQQIAEKRNQQLTEKICHMMNSNPKLQEVLNKRLEEDKLGGKKYQCDKCTFCSPSLQALQRHYELHHGSKMPSQCWFCDYSVDRMDLLYQHMKISHTRKWKALSQDPKYASQIQRMNLAFSHSSSTAGHNNNNNNNNDSPPGSSPATMTSNDGMAMDLSSKRSSTDMSHDIVYITRQQYTWSGIPVNVVPGDNTLNFVCPNCPFTDASIGNTCTHVMQSHSAMSKFNCKRCNFSDDNIHIMSDHCKTSHPVAERVVEVLDFKQLNFTDFQMVQLNAMKEKIPQLLNAGNSTKKSVAVNSDNNETMTKCLSCPFCPFKTPIKEDMKQHVLYHNSESRFRCEQCDFSVDSPTIMSEHVKVHAPNYMSEDKLNIKPEINVKQEKDGLSESELKTKDVMKDNGEITKSSSPKSKTAGRIRYRCSVCPYHTTCKSNIFKHKRQHVIPKRYKCPKCSYSAARAVLLRNHIESHSVPVEDDGYYHDIFYDPNSSTSDKIDDVEDVEMEGDDESSTSDDLESEMDTKAIADLEAKDILEAEAAFKASMLLEEAAGGENALDKQFRKQKCAHCPFSSNSAYEFRKHLHFHGTQERYKCDHCNYSIDRLNLLTQHRKLHTDEPDFNVNPPASNLLNTSFILQQNELNASSEEGGGKLSQEPNVDGNSACQFHCAHCPYAVSCQKSYEIHTSSHGQRKRYICDYCDWSADRLSLLSHHRKVHEKESSYNADPRDKSFLNQEFDDGTSGEFEAKLMEIPNFNKPVKTGEGESAKSPPFKLTVVKKSYHCKLCPYNTKSKSSFQFHETMHGYESEFKCSECNFAAINKGILQQHILLHSMAGHSDASLQTRSRSLSYGDQSEVEEPMDASGDQSKGGNSTDESPAGKILPGSTNSKPSSGIPELTCERCPFTASSVIVLKEHMQCHNVQEKLVCPYCDFGATTREIMFPHIQIHFPGTKLERSAMERMLEEHAGKNNNNNNIIPDGSLNLSSNTQESLSSIKESQIIKTKIYVCQYCEREFEAKSLMIQHEKQHLVGGSHME